MTDWTKELIDTNISSTGLTVDNIQIDGNTISSTDTDGDITLAPDGSGDVAIGGGLKINGVLVTSTVAELNILDGKAFLDEDDMTSDSATGIASQQSIKAYVNSQVTVQDLDFAGDSGGELSIDLDSESLTIAGGVGIDTSGDTNTLTVAIDSTVATLTGTQTLTNKTLTSPDVNTPDIDGGTVDGAIIGGATPAAGVFTTLTANTSLTGTLLTAAQPNITSLGTLVGLALDGDKDITPGDGSMIHLDASILTDDDTAEDGTVLKFTSVAFEAPTLAATNSGIETIDSATVYISGAVIEGDNQTIKDTWALWVDSGGSRFDGTIFCETIASLVTDGHIYITPNGAGKVIIGGELTVMGDTIRSSSDDAVLIFSDDSASFANNLTVNGKLEIASTADDALNLSGITVESGAPTGSSKSIPIKCDETIYFIELKTSPPGAP